MRAQASSAQVARVPGDAVPRWHALLIIALIVAQMLCGLFASMASSDTNRDIFFAEQITSGRYFPLTGAEINHTIHLGPLWYYLLAPALWLVPNAAAVTALMGLMSAMQFPLAYALGRRFGDAREAILFVAALAIPGWISVAFASMTHTIIIVPALLFAAYAAASYRSRPDGLHALLLGVALTLLASAHPTCLLLAFSSLGWAALETPRSRSALIHAALAIGPPMLSLLPMVYVQWHDASSDAASIARYATAGWHIATPMAALTQIYAVLAFGPKYLLRFWLEWSNPAQHAWFGVYILLIATAAVGLTIRMREPGARRLITVLLALLFGQALFVCSLRSLMPPWMVYAQWPLFAALVACGLAGVCARSWLGSSLVWVSLAAMLCLTLCVYEFLAQGLPDHAEVKPSPGRNGTLDVRDYEKNKYVYRLPRLRFTELFAIGEPLCEPASLYGHYAYFVDYTFAVSAMAACGSDGGIEFGGMPRAGRVAMLGLHASAWREAHMTPQRWTGALGISTPTHVWHSPLALGPVFPRLENFPRELSIDTRVFEVDGDASASEAVLISHRAHRYAPFKVVGVRADGMEIAPNYSDLIVSIFRVPPESHLPNTIVHWQIEIEGTASLIDVLTFASSSTNAQ